MTLRPRFERLGVALQPNDLPDRRECILNPACARLRNSGLQLYPRMVLPGNISRIGSFRAYERADGALLLDQLGIALEPEAPYERRDGPDGYGCEDPRVTFIEALDRYVMAYVALGPRGPEIALAISQDGLAWKRLGLLKFRERDAPFADKDAAFFPEPVRSPSGVRSFALYHRPTLEVSVERGALAWPALERLPLREREDIAIGYIPVADVLRDEHNLCSVVETHRLKLPRASWGSIKVGAGTPPVRIREGWLSVIHGVDPLVDASGTTLLRYCAGLIVLDAEDLSRVIYRSKEPLFVPETKGERSGTVGDVVFPTGIDPQGEARLGRSFDIYYGMADDEIGRGRLTL